MNKSENITEDSDGSPRRKLPLRAILVVAIIFIATGIILVFQGLGGSSSGGCFFWPIPLIVICGAGTGGVSPLLLIPVVLVFVFMIVFSWFSYRRFRQEPSNQGQILQQIFATFYDILIRETTDTA